MRRSVLMLVLVLSGCSTAPVKKAPPVRRIPRHTSQISARPRLIVPLSRVTRRSGHEDIILASFSSNVEMTDAFDALVLKYAQLHHLNPRIVKAIIASESEFNVECVSPVGARGLMQLLPETAEEMGVRREDLDEAEANIRAGTAYLDRLFYAAWKRYRLKGSYRNAPPWVLQRVIAAYYAGPRALSSRRWGVKTRRYVRTVMVFYRSSVTRLRQPVGPMFAARSGAVTLSEAR